MHDPSKADELTARAFEALLTTRRWDAARGPLLRHVLGIVASIRHHDYRSTQGERREKAEERFQHELVGTQASSPEDASLAHAEEQDAQARAERELEELQASVAAHPLAPRVLRCRRDGLTSSKAVAEALGVPPSDVYLANDVLKSHLRKIRAQGSAGEGETR